MSMIAIKVTNLRKWFPANDPFAATVARLCILREDLKLEGLGAIARGMRKLDGNSVSWRILYFLRNSIKTLGEIRSAIETLRQINQFQKLLAKQSKEDQEKFESFCKMITSTHSLIKELRNAVGGHVLQGHIVRALDSQEFDWQGTLEMGETTETLHYKFAGELLLAILLPDIPASQREAKIIEILKTAGELTAALGTIDLIFWMYLKDKRVV
jgi:hypothetical protein